MTPLPPNFASIPPLSFPYALHFPSSSPPGNRLSVSSLRRAARLDEGSAAGSCTEGGGEHPQLHDGLQASLRPGAHHPGTTRAAGETPSRPSICSHGSPHARSFPLPQSLPLSVRSPSTLFSSSRLLTPQIPPPSQPPLSPSSPIHTPPHLAAASPSRQHDSLPVRPPRTRPPPPALLRRARVAVGRLRVRQGTQALPLRRSRLACDWLPLERRRQRRGQVGPARPPAGRYDQLLPALALLSLRSQAQGRALKP